MSAFEQDLTQSASTLRRPDDRTAWWIIGLSVFLFLLVEGTTEHMEVLRQGSGNVRAEWLYQVTSHVAVLIATLTIPVWLNRFPISLTNWKRRIPIYALGFLAFTILHILLMVGMRHAFWPLVADGSYDFGLLRLEPWIYEMRKDAMTYLLLLSVFLTSRHIDDLSRELQETRDAARETGRLTLKSGGRLVTLPASEIIYAKAAANYVEIYTETGQHFVRLTLSELETLMRDARAEPLRLHRSYLVARPALREVNGQLAYLVTGASLPIGRAYRAQVFVA